MCFFINENLHKLVLKFKFFRCSIFNDQLRSRLVRLSDNRLSIIQHLFSFVKGFLKLFLIFFDFFKNPYFRGIFHPIFTLVRRVRI